MGLNDYNLVVDLSSNNNNGSVCPVNGKSRHSDKFYHKAALQMIADNEFYGNVRKCGIYEGKRAYEPILKDEYKLCPPITGLPLVILVDDDGNAEILRDILNYGIYSEIRRNSAKR